MLKKRALIKFCAVKKLKISLPLWEPELAKKNMISIKSGITKSLS